MSEPVPAALPGPPPLVCPDGTSPVPEIEPNTSGSACARPDGTLHGPAVQWWKDGSRAREGTHQNGLRSGTWTSWDREGPMSQQGAYVDGKASGRWQAWHWDGKPSTDGHYGAGVKVGEWIEWWPGSGKKWSRVHYNTTAEAPRASIRWHENGAKSDEYTLVAFKYEGLYTTWHPNGQKAREGAYEADKPVGTWTFWREDGTLESTRTAEDVAANGW